MRERNQGPAIEDAAEEAAEEAVRQHMKIVRLLAGSMMAGVVVFGALTLVLLASDEFQPQAEAFPDLLPQGLAAAAIFLLLAGPFILRRLASEPASDFADALRKHRTRVVVSYAVWEGAGALGVMLALITGLTSWGFALAGAALVMMGLAWPKPEDLGSR